MAKQKYLHGFDKTEQDRLYTQAKTLEPFIFEKINYSKSSHLLEVGCGVGAQTELLLKHFPHLKKITGIDASEAQLKRARIHLKKEKRVHLKKVDAAHLPFSENSFDSAFLCWFLEHVSNPVEILREVRRTLKRNAVVYCTEVLNATFYLHPYSPATLKYWFEFNDHQWTLKGDPFVGGRLANHLLEAGYQNVECWPISWHLDNREPKARAEYIEDLSELLLSAAPGLIKAGRVTKKLVTEMTHELEKLKDDPDAVFFYTVIQARAEVK